MKKWQQQYNRVKRWYERLKLVNESKKHDLPTDYYLDEVYAFFINCYHLKDWIKNDENSKVSSEEIEDFVKNSEPLKICGDICNGSKHLSINRPRNNSNTRIGSRHFALTLGGSSPTIYIKYDIVSGNKTYDAFTLAIECLNEWKQFLLSKKLL